MEMEVEDKGLKISWKTKRDKDSKGQRNLEDSGRGLLPAVEEHSLAYNKMEVTVSKCMLNG